MAYIGEYLKTVQEFSQNGLSQFVCDKVEDTSGFIRQVADFIINECGIESERVVVNYGATKGSIKIPVVILSKDLTQAECALWCETQLDKTYNYTDYNVKYYGILEQRGWKMMRVFINDWVVCQVEEKEKIKKYINENTKQGE